MNPITAGTAIGAAAVTVGRGAIGAVGSGLSFAAELMRAAGGSSSAAETKQDASVAARAALQARIDEMQKRIEQHLSAAGVQLAAPVELVSNGQGGIAVAGPHPQQAAIEELLGSDILLERDFHLLASDYEELGGAIGLGDLPATMTIRIESAAGPKARTQRTGG